MIQEVVLRTFKIFLIIMCAFFSQSSLLAADSQPPNQSVYQRFSQKFGESLETKESEPTKGSRYVRSTRPFSIAASYAYLDLWIPSKIGFSIGYTPAADTTYEFDYQKGSFGIPFLVTDIGEINETRYSFLMRSYNLRESFHFIYGINYTDFEIFLGRKYWYNVTDIETSEDLINIKTIGVNWGMGNRWTLNRGWIISVDWFTLHLPVFLLESNTPIVDNIEDENDADTLEGVISIFEHFPSASFLKIAAGYSF